MGRGGGNGEHFRPDPVQIAQAMEINRLNAHAQALQAQLQLSAQTVQRLQMMVRLNQLVLARVLQASYPQEDPNVPSYVLPMEQAEKEMHDHSLGTQLLDEFDVEGVKHWAVFPILTTEQLDAARRRVQQREEQAKAQAAPAAPPSPIILPGRPE